VNAIETSVDGWLPLTAPAKVNLMLAVHGRREDGFHELTSVIAAVGHGDRLKVRIGHGADTLECTGAELPQDASNLVLRAAKGFREATGCSEYFDFQLEKRIPVGAGLGGGSSDAVAALKGMNALLQCGLNAGQLRELAAGIGSDCPFFVEARPSLMQGRGERIEPLPEAASQCLAGQQIVLFKPPFGVSTAWAYSQLASRPQFFEKEAATRARLEEFLQTGHCGNLLHNVFEPIVGAKYLATSTLLKKLREDGFDCLMSGSGSACFALIEDPKQTAELKSACTDCWGESIFWVETSLAE